MLLAYLGAFELLNHNKKGVFCLQNFLITKYRNLQGFSTSRIPIKKSMEAASKSNKSTKALLKALNYALEPRVFLK